jgi:hypothetical protein
MDWKVMWRAKEEAMRVRLGKQVEKLDEKTHLLPPLELGNTVRMRNMAGNNPGKWDKTGIVTQIGEHGKYLVRVDGSRHVTLRNRQFLQKYTRYCVQDRGLLGVKRLVSGDTLPRQHLATRPDGTPTRGRGVGPENRRSPMG